MIRYWQVRRNRHGRAASVMARIALVTALVAAAVTGVAGSGHAAVDGHGRPAIALTATSRSTTPQPPTAAIDSPADGGVVKLGSSVTTSFSCFDGADGPGIASCADSGGAAGGAGHLYTRPRGVHTYTVTATSRDGQIAAAAIQYTVSRTGRSSRSIVAIPPRVLNAAVQPCALIACGGNQGPHDHLTNTLGSYCQQYDCRSPMDLVPSNGLDPNLFPLNPDWTSYLTHHQPPFSLEDCGHYIHSQFDPHFPRCTSQPVDLDKATGFAGEICKLGREPADAFHGHVNYGPATYEGNLFFFEKSPIGTDDEYSLDLVPSKPDGVTHYNNAVPAPSATTPNSIHIEFDTDETIDHYDDNAWWKDFHSKVDDNLPFRAIDGNRAVVTGLAGIDTVHSASAELHPVYAIALQTYPGSPGAQPGADQWAFFVRNFGNEGYCSSNEHRLPAAPITVRIPWPAGATGVSLPSHDLHWSGNGRDVTASVVPGYGVLLRFQIPPLQPQHPLSAFTPMYWGTVNLRWSYPPGQAAPRPVKPGRARPLPSNRDSGPEVDVEPIAGALFARLPAGKRKRALAMIPHPAGILPHTRTGRIRTSSTGGPLAPPGPFVRPRPALSVRKRGAAELRALCWAYGDRIPGFEKACPGPRRSTGRTHESAVASGRPACTPGNRHASTTPPVPERCCAHVSTRAQLLDALAAGSKYIFVANNAQIDLAVSDDRTGSSYWVVHVPDGVTIESGRSPRTPGGLLYMSHQLQVKQKVMLDVGSNTRISGLRLRGYRQRDTAEHDDATQAIMVDGQAMSGHVAANNDLIDNNEIYGWPAAGVNVVDAPAGDESIRITGNYIHNNVQCNLGYGVAVSGSGAPVIDRNVFDFNRHDVSSDGRFGTGYRAELNFVLTSGPTCGGHYNQHFDVHGTGPDGYGGPAGRNYSIQYNTIRGAQDFLAGFGVRPAFELRGIPAQAIFAHNAVVHDDESDAVNVHKASLTEEQLRMNGELVVFDNQYKIWTASQLAAGRFGNDGCSDVFQATGAVWVYSPCGRGIWRFLNQSTLRLDRLAFGDFNGDAKTDVFSQSGRQWRVSYGGTGPWTPLPAGSGIPMNQYRFGDFDGDGKTDIFRTDGSRFYFSSGGATGWKPLAFSHLKVDSLRFGEFRHSGRTDVFGLANGHWSVSDGGATQWHPLNLELSSDLAELAFADFDGDGRTDIARCRGGTAEASSNGATPWRPLAFACRKGFPGMLFGSFTGSKHADALSFGTAPLLLSRYSLSRAGRTPFFAWSLADML
jgi:hypothetical protein